MPDILTHYVVSYLISTRVFRFKESLVIALVGLLPDIDVLLMIHRWVSHSLLIPTSTLLLIPLITKYLGREYLKYLVVSVILYILHIILDLFTASTPILWPINTQSYFLTIKLDGMLSDSGIRLTPNIVVNTEVSDFTRRTVLEGPLITDVGVVITIATVLTLTTEYFIKRFSGKYSSGF